jgi:hypothetical protein
MFFSSQHSNYSPYSLTVKYVPEWLPGAGFKRKARMWKDIVWQMPTAPFDVVKQALVR